jgi:arginyl-tRNA synthetase
MVVNAVAKAISDVSGVEAYRVAEDIEIPPEVDMGDYAYPCFALASQRGESPAKIASDMADTLDDAGFESVRSQGPYVNIVLHPSQQLEAARGSVEVDAETIVVEFPSPNTNKPLHVGHALNMAIGQSTSNLLEAVGHNVITENLYNDRGIHISKSMLAYEKEGEGDSPGAAGEKPDHFVGDYYVRYGELVDEDPSLADEAQDMLQRWEDGDESVRALWDRMRGWCLDGIKETLSDFDVDIDKDRFESDIWEDGRDIVRAGLDDGVFSEDDDGAVVADLEDVGLGTKHVLRSDGTTVYMTQDIGLANHRAEDYDLDRIVHVVGQEQEYHFSCLFEILDRLGYGFADKLHHLSYGLLRLSEGTMSSREGTAIHADTVRDEMISLAEDEVRERYDGLDEDDVESRAETIGMGALKFYLLRTDPSRDVVFNPEESLSFTGETGPYIQYTYARIQSILEKSVPVGGGLDTLTSTEERGVLRLLMQYPDQAERAAKAYNPSVIANHALQLAQAFNEFYHEHRVLVDDVDVRGGRRQLCVAVAEQIEACLGLLGIGVVEEM